MRRFLLVTGTLGLLFALWVYFGNDIARALESDTPSISYGTPDSGSMENGKRLPTSGSNFRAYSRLGAALGRNSVNGKVRDVVVEAYVQLAKTHPDLRFVYGETGWPSGGSFKPHRTHENGMSVDFMVPVRKNGRITTLSTLPWHKFGYAIEFDSTGKAGDVAIDFEAVAFHLAALDEAATAHGLAIHNVIFAPEFVPRLEQVPGAWRLIDRLPWFQGTPWVRHDEHYHVDFR
jgi:penicillin-insensitive murein DD-endopeptidase